MRRRAKETSEREDRNGEGEKVDEKTKDMRILRKCVCVCV